MSEKKEPTSINLNKLERGDLDSSLVDFNTPEEVQDLRKRRFFRIAFICGVLLVITDASLEFFGPSSQLPEDDAARLGESLTFGRGGGVMVNPRLTWFERNFCSGLQTSLFCTERTLHPIAELVEPLGEGNFENFIRERGDRIPTREWLGPGTREKTIAKRGGKVTF